MVSDTRQRRRAGRGNEGSVATSDDRTGAAHDGSTRYLPDVDPDQLRWDRYADDGDDDAPVADGSTVPAPTSVVRARPGLTVVTVLIVELVLIAAGANQAVTRHLTSFAGSHPGTIQAGFADAVRVLAWRFTPLSNGKDDWLGAFAAIVAVLVLSMLLTLAVVRGPITTFRAFFGTWTAVVAAVVVGHVVGLVVARPFYFPPGSITPKLIHRNAGAGFTRVGASRQIVYALFDGSGAYAVALGLALGLVVAVIAAIVAVSARRRIPVAVPTPPAPVPGPAPSSPPPYYGSAEPYRDAPYQPLYSGSGYGPESARRDSWASDNDTTALPREQATTALPREQATTALPREQATTALPRQEAQSAPPREQRAPFGAASAASRHETSVLPAVDGGMPAEPFAHTGTSTPETAAPETAAPEPAAPLSAAPETAAAEPATSEPTGSAPVAHRAARDDAPTAAFPIPPDDEELPGDVDRHPDES